MKKIISFGGLVVGCLVLMVTLLTNSNSVFAEKKSKENFFAKSREIKKEFQVKAGGTLKINLETGGSIEVKSWDKDLFSAIASIKKDDENNVEFRFTQNGNDVEVSSEYTDREENHNVNVSVIINVPKSYSVEFNTMGGAITLDNLIGEFSGRTMGGPIQFTELKGKVEATTMGGPIIISDSEVDGSVKTMGGPITLTNIVGDIDASTMGGPVIQNNVKRKNNSSRNEVRVTTMGGPINIDTAPNGAYAKTMGGEININKAADHVYAETYGGSITINEVDGSVEASTKGGDIEVHVIGDPTKDNKDISLSSLRGDVTLTVPDNFSMDIDIEVRANDKEDSSFDDYNKIESDFKMDVSSSSNKSSKKYRKIVHASGSVNGGKNKIRIKTVDGKVLLKKA